MRCIDCQLFVRDNPPKSINEMGLCGVMVSYYEKHKAINKTMSPAAVDTAFRRLGGKLFYPYAERVCQKFKDKFFEAIR